MPIKKPNKGLTVKKVQKAINNIPERIADVLNDKQKAFCKEYSWDYNGTRAYKVAYNVENDNHAAVNANWLLSNTKIKEYLKYLKDNLAEQAGISPLMILNEHKKLAFSSIAYLHLTWVTRKEFNDLTDDQKSCIQEISTKTNTVFDNVKNQPIEVEYVKIKLYDKQKSMDAINKMLGYDAATKLEVSGKIINVKMEDD